MTHLETALHYVELAHGNYCGDDYDADGWANDCLLLAAHAIGLAGETYPHPHCSKGANEDSKTGPHLTAIRALAKSVSRTRALQFDLDTHDGRVACSEHVEKVHAEFRAVVANIKQAMAS